MLEGMNFLPKQSIVNIWGRHSATAKINHKKNISQDTFIQEAPLSSGNPISTSTLLLKGRVPVRTASLFTVLAFKSLSTSVVTNKKYVFLKELKEPGYNGIVYLYIYSLGLKGVFFFFES